VKLTAFALPGQPFGLVPASASRDWMDASVSGFANRCLPLKIANAHGWVLVNPFAFSAVWNGSEAVDAVTVTPDAQPDLPGLPVSHFGHGILTFHIPVLFRTEPGLNLLVTGPFNAPKHAIQPLSGIVETDWAPYTFTMNWRFTAADTPVRFERGEPFCQIMPMPRGLVEEQEPVIRNLQDAPDDNAAFEAWSRSRSQWNADLKVPGTQANRDEWQKAYFQGRDAAGARVESHQTKLKVRPFDVQTEAEQL
jgi:Family of unknown function (DUF6065)